MRIFDLHSDILTAINNPYDVLKSFNNNVKVCTAIYKGWVKNNGLFSVINEFKCNNLPNALLCFEDVGYANVSIEDIILKNPLYVQLTYNDENKYGFGCNFNNKLKPLGVDAVKKLKNSNIYVDVSHLSNSGALQVCELTDRVICSHTLFYNVYKHKRNISNDLVKLIVERNGVIGACLVGYFVGDDNSFENFFKHIDYFLQNFGDDNLALGSDFYGSDIFTGDIDNYNKLQILINAFYKNGYTTNTIEKFLYKNAEKLLNI